MAVVVLGVAKEGNVTYGQALFLKFDNITVKTLPKICLRFSGKVVATMGSAETRAALGGPNSITVASLNIDGVPFNFALGPIAKPCCTSVSGGIIWAVKPPSGEESPPSMILNKDTIFHDLQGVAWHTQTLIRNPALRACLGVVSSVVCRLLVTFVCPFVLPPSLQMCVAKESKISEDVQHIVGDPLEYQAPFLELNPEYFEQARLQRA
jgi:hypothetical protein